MRNEKNGSNSFPNLWFNRLTKTGFPNQCAWLQGAISTAKDEIARKVDVYSFDYVLPDGPSVPNKKNGASKNNGKETKNKLDEYKEALRDFQNSQISKLGKLLNSRCQFLHKVN